MRSLIEELLYISKERVRAEFITGYKSIESVYSFVLGYGAAARRAKFDDQRFKAFCQWLMKRGDFPNNGWAEKLLADCKGDSKAAVDVFLDRVEKFVEEGG